MVLSNNPDAFLDNLNAVSAYNDQRGQVMNDFSTELSRLKLRKSAVKTEAGDCAPLQEQMAAEKAQVDDKAAKAKAVLDDLEAKARAKLLAGGWTGPLPDVPASGRAAAAVRFAMAQVGKAYAYGAAGPNAYDCSGLTMRAWGAAGVGLPHSSRAQQGSGARVSESQLRPGDLVFYYSPVSHVGMYIGNGLIVNAENPGAGCAGHRPALDAVRRCGPPRLRSAASRRYPRGLRSHVLRPRPCPSHACGRPVSSGRRGPGGSPHRWRLRPAPRRGHGRLLRATPASLRPRDRAGGGRWVAPLAEMRRPSARCPGSPPPWRRGDGAPSRRAG